VGTTDLSKTDPGRYLDGADDRDQSQTPVIFLGKSFEPGQSYELCEAFLMPKGASIVGAVWITFDPKHPTKSNIVWKK
jgi:hypothetical protein